MLDIVANIVRLLGVVLTIIGLWQSVAGLRVVVSGRIDERRRSAVSLKRGLPLLVIGLLLLFAGTWITTGAPS